MKRGFAVTEFPYDDIVEDVPALKRGMVWCVRCGRSQAVNSAGCIARGWPKCCNETMAIDSPEERASQQNSA